MTPVTDLPSVPVHSRTNAAKATDHGETDMISHMFVYVLAFVAALTVLHFTIA